MKSTVKLDKKLIHEIWNKSLVFAYVSMGLGLAIIILAVAFLVRAFDLIWLFVAILGGVDILLSIYFAWRILSSGSKIEASNAVTEIEFDEDHLILCVFKGEEKASETKIYYKDVQYYRVTKNYIVGYISAQQFFPVEKREDTLDFFSSKGIKRK